MSIVAVAPVRQSKVGVVYHISEVSSSGTTLPISPTNWQRLVEANDSAVKTCWAAAEVFATGVGSDYRSIDLTVRLLSTGKP